MHEDGFVTKNGIKPLTQSVNDETMNKYIILFSLLNVTNVFAGEHESKTDMSWPFDQARNAATVTTTKVMDEKYPVLMVVHYLEDDSWAFTCGTTNKSKDLMLVTMAQIIGKDSTLMTIADLPSGWSATRKTIHDDWVRTKD